MHQHEDPHATFENEPAHAGGAAPEHRRCQYIKADGKGCRDWAVRGQGFCYRHGVFLRPESIRHIDVPLLEDEASIVLVLSETLRALACGTMPVNNGRLILDGCRLAHTIHIEKQAAARLRRRDQPLQCEEQSEEPEAGSEEQPPDYSAPSPGEPSTPSSERCPACGTLPSDPTAQRAEPCEVCGAPASDAPAHQPHRARNLPDHSDRKPADVDERMPSLSALRDEEAYGQVLAAHAAPLDPITEEELAVAVR
ncbi:MAG: hypothetical protein ACLGXA_24925 [Acidobacteriota bacterium]